jgi:hypothetical protein
MNYTSGYRLLKELFDPSEREQNIPGTGMKIVNAEFISREPAAIFSNTSDNSIPENRSFSYPVFEPANCSNDKIILLLHGLNERSWIKYLTWARFLAENTGSRVVMFPISFHINRSPEAWRDPRKMNLLMNTRGSAMASFANAALSTRLTEDPMRFFYSGYRTANDITQLLISIRDGKHPVIPRTDRFDIFSYSIGGFLAEIMMMGNPGDLLGKSKLFIFCGGSVFSNMQGTSKLIMDRAAFDRIYNFYLNEFESTIHHKSQLFDFLSSDTLGLAFRSMIGFDRLRSFREKMLGKLRGRIMAVSLLRDQVIPPDGVTATLGIQGSGSVELMDFPYDYTHENPFPVFNSPLSRIADLCFETVFSKAAVFLR